MSETNNRQRYQLPGMPDLEQVERTLAEVKSGTLPPDQQAEKERYLRESLVAINAALPSVEQLETLARGIEHLVQGMQAGKFKPGGDQA
jgi:hypothetical protein